MVLADANAHTRPAEIDCKHVGQHNPGITNYNGLQLYTLLPLHHLGAVNTFHDVGATFYKTRGAELYSSRVDYFLAPISHCAANKKCELWNRAGAAIQLIQTRRPNDHRPLVAVLALALAFSADPQIVRWDHDALANVVLFGGGRPAFVREVEAKCEAAIRDDKLLWEQETPANAYD